MPHRLFIALPLTSSAQATLGAVQQDLAGTHASVRCPAPENIHLTLKFIGDVEDAAVAPIKDVVETVARETEAFEWELSSLGTFPQKEFPRVVWVGVGAGTDPIATLADRMEEQLAPLGIARADRPFSPHITIARIRTHRQRGRAKNEEREIRGAVTRLRLPPCDPLAGDAVILYRSQLSPGGARYTALVTAPLRTPRQGLII